MKKILLLLIVITFSTNLYADKLLKNGFLNNKMSYEKDQNINDPTNNCLDVAIITAPEKRTQKTIDKLKTVAGRALSK